MEAARAHPFPPDVLKILAEARRYAEGTAVRIEVNRADDLATVQTLAAIKLAH